MTWWQIRLVCNRDQLDAIENRLLELGAQSLSLTDAGDEPLFEPLPGEMPLWRESVVSATFDASVDRDSVNRELGALMAAGEFDAAWDQLLEENWSESYKQHFEPLACGPGLWVVPSWCQPPEPDAINIRLDPGMAFGTGTHATTALCLARLAARPPRDLDVIDYGCGSGILAVAAGKLGARRLRAVDIDPQALRACADNFERNQIDPELYQICAPAELDDSSCDLLLANILAGTLTELAAEFSNRLRPGGRILLSGILKHQAKAIQSAYENWFDFEPASIRDDWVCLDGTRREPEDV